MRILIGSIVGAALLFVWGYVFWTVLPFSKQVIKPLPGGDEVVAALQANETATGVYQVPGAPAEETPEAMEAFAKAHEAGPMAMLYYRSEGEKFMSPEYFGFGFLQMFLAALAAAIALSACDVHVYPGRVMIVVWMGVFCALWTSLSEVNWFRFPMSHFWLQLAYTVSSSIILGIVLAMFVKPPNERREMA